MAQISRAEFLQGARSVAGLKQFPHSEIGFFGRSNVGKSSFLNRLVVKRGLAHTSSKPGSTREINLFSVVMKAERFPERTLVLADLPGFGFARFSKTEREDTESQIVEYLQTRDQLAVACLLNDCRREPGDAELAIRKVAADNDVPLIVVATKVDVLGRAERDKAIKRLAGAYALQPADVIVTGERVDIGAFWARVAAIL
jgi:GTP-binding protein